MIYATVPWKILNAEIEVAYATLQLGLEYRNSHTLAEHYGRNSLEQSRDYHLRQF